MKQLELELFEPRTDLIGVVISEDPYVEILGPVTWSMEHNSLVAVARVENVLAVIAVNERKTKSPNVV